MDQQFFNNKPENNEQLSGGAPENQENAAAEEVVEEVVEEVIKEESVKEETVEENAVKEENSNNSQPAQEKPFFSDVNQPAGNGAFNTPPKNNAPYWQNNNYQQNPNQPYSAPYQNQQYNNGQGFNGYNQNPYMNANQYGAFNTPPQPPKKRSTGMKVFIALVVVIVVIAIASMVSIFSGNLKNGIDKNDNGIVSQENTTQKIEINDVDDVEANQSTNAAGEAAKVAQIAKKYNVGILIYQKNSLYTEGSGVIVKEDNSGKYTYIITCAHVVNHSNVAVSVLLEDGTEYQADVVGMDTRTDLAVVRIEATGLPKAELASSENLIVGQYVYAVGNPGGSEFFGSVTNGIISAIDRPVSSSTGYETECIQHTSAINPGNSGGALVNGEGKVIGINSMKIASTEYEGMGFAVPSSVVAEVFNSIIENGYVAGRAKLGISYATPSNYSQTYAMYVQMKGLPTGTIVIAEIAQDSDLANKDVKVGDMIIAVNGKDMKDSGMLAEMIEDMSAGDSITLTIVRVNTDNWTQTETDVKVTLVEDRGLTDPAPAENSADDNSGYYSGSDEDLYEYFKEFFGNGGYGYGY